MSTKRISYNNGDRIGNFIFIEDRGVHIKKGGSTARKALFRCVCGNEIERPIYIIKEGQMSCGCMKLELCNKKEHGLSKHPLMKRWDSMIGRCYRKNLKSYQNYGGRGISVCEEWRNSFKSFYDWAVDNEFKNELTLDRIDNNGNYEPSNCRWVDRKTQTRNTRKLFAHNSSGFRGVTKSKQSGKWLARISINNKTQHIGVFATKEEAGAAYDTYIADNNLEHTKNG